MPAYGMDRDELGLVRGQKADSLWNRGVPPGRSPKGMASL
jgi:hypothetical protein